MLSACGNLDITNTNQPTAEELTGSPSVAVLAPTAIGIQTQASVDIGAQIQQWGIYGREGWNLLGNDPRETGEEISGPQDPGGRAGGEWAGKYGAIRTINAYLAAIENASMPDAQKAASRGFAKTIKADLLHRLAVRSGPTGLPIDVDRPIDAEPAPLVPTADAMKAASDLLNEALTDLNAGGASFPFAFVEGFNGFDTPATFAKFNRALAAKVLVHRATFFQCTACWTEAGTADRRVVHHELGTPGVAQDRRLLRLYGDGRRRPEPGNRDARQQSVLGAPVDHHGCADAPERVPEPALESKNVWAQPVTLTG